MYDGINRIAGKFYEYKDVSQSETSVVYYADETKYSFLVSSLPYIFAPLICLQIYAMGVRIYYNGMTPSRYMAAFFSGKILRRCHIGRADYRTFLHAFESSL